MRKFFIAAAVATSALAAAAPAAAQYYPAPQPVPYGYGQPGYGQPGYGYNYQGQDRLIRSYIVRVDQLRNRVERLDGRDRISEREAARLRREAAQLQQRVRAYAQNGLNWRERQDLDNRIAWVQRAIRSERWDGNDRRYDNRDGYREWTDEYGRRNTFVDRNGNGVDDRWERNRDRDDD